ncbi:MAG: hypothetical protein KatS3mg047_1476 [Bellilinea sp.]|nr:MAG: hypothetical protein KatS3mg047_1476 [Bellilinea sp.]
MIKTFDRQEFRSFHDRNSGRVFADLCFKYCRFVSCSVSTTLSPRKRSLVQNICFYGCEVRGCMINPAIVEDVLISSLKTHTLLQTWGTVFKHVKLEGNIGRIMISPFIAPGVAKPHQQAAFDKANAEYYQQVDWALDISEARFYECDIRGIPARLIRRDPRTQVVVTREKALLGDWRKLDLSRTFWSGWIELFLQEDALDVVLVAPKRHPKFNDLLDGLKMLRDAGVAEPD